MGLFGKPRDVKRHDNVLPTPAPVKEEKEYIQARKIFEAPPEARVSDISFRFVLEDSAFTDEIDSLDFSELSIVYLNCDKAIETACGDDEEKKEEIRKRKQRIYEVGLERVKDNPLYFIYTEKTRTSFKMELDCALAYVEKIRAKEVCKYLNENNEEQGPFYIVDAEADARETVLKEIYLQGGDRIAVDGSRLFIETEKLMKEVPADRESTAAMRSKMQYLIQRYMLLSDEDKGKCNYTIISDLAAAGRNMYLAIAWDGEPGKEGTSFRIKCAADNDGHKFAFVFTDKIAAETFTQEKSDFLVETLERVYEASVKDNEEVTGIIVNPGNEKFIIPRQMLAAFFKEDPIKDVINKAEKLYLVMSKVFGGKYPSINAHGETFLFTDKAKADEMVEKNAFMNLYVKEFTADEFAKELKTWYSEGIVRILLDGKRHTSRDEYLDDEKVKGWDYFGSNLIQTFIRYSQVAPVADDNFRAMGMTYLNAASHSIMKTPFIIPIIYEGEPRKSKKNDTKLHFSEAGLKLYQELMADEKAAKVFYGIEGYGIEDKPCTKTIKFCTVANNGEEFIPMFTDLKLMNKLFGKEVRALVTTYEALKSDFDKVTGAVINPGGISFTLNNMTRKTVEEMAAGPVKVYTAEGKKE